MGLEVELLPDNLLRVKFRASEISSGAPFSLSKHMSPLGQKGGRAALKGQGIPKSWQRPRTQRDVGGKWWTPLPLNSLNPFSEPGASQAGAGVLSPQCSFANS